MHTAVFSRACILTGSYNKQRNIFHSNQRKTTVKKKKKRETLKYKFAKIPYLRKSPSKFHVFAPSCNEAVSEEPPDPQ